MRKSRVLRQLQITTTLVVMICLVGGFLFLKQQNRSGFSGGWSQYLEQAAESAGLKCSVNEFQMSFFRGLIVKNVILYDKENPDQVVANFGEVIIDIDKKQIGQGQFTPRSIKFKRGKVFVAHAENDFTQFKEINGTVLFKDPYDIEIQDLHFLINKVNVSIKGTLFDHLRPSPQPLQKETKFTLPPTVKAFLKELETLQFSSEKQNEINIDFQYANKPQTNLLCDISVSTSGVKREALELDSFDAFLRLKNAHLTLEELSFSYQGRPTTLSGYYHAFEQTGHFKARSKAMLTSFLKDAFKTEKFDLINFQNPPTISAQGKILPPKQGSSIPELTVFGQAKADAFEIFKNTYDSLETKFSWKSGDLYLSGMEVLHEEGQLNGDLLFKDETVRYDATSTLPVELYKPFLEKGGILENIIDKTKIQKTGGVTLNISGTIRTKQLNEWESKGSISVKKTSYNGVPIKAGYAYFDLNPIQPSYRNITATFDYAQYKPSPYANLLPLSGNVSVNEVIYDAKKDFLVIDQLEGTAWPGPLISLFTPLIGEYIEDTVLLTSPPSFVTNGIIAGTRSDEKSKLITELSSPAQLYYNFLGKDVFLDSLETTIINESNATLIRNVDATLLGGELGGELTINYGKGKDPTYSGDIFFNKLDIEKISETYTLTNEQKGTLTGRSDFSGTAEKVNTLNGRGVLSLDRGNLFYVPIFGPLSPIMSGILGNKRNSHEKVNNLSCTFEIENGVIRTNDLLSTTDSTEINGEGFINLNDEQIDMTVRAKTKGLLGLITLPLKPFSRLLQFRGTGNYNEPEWKNSPFSKTDKQKLLNYEPGKAEIVE